MLSMLRSLVQSQFGELRSCKAHDTATQKMFTFDALNLRCPLGAMQRVHGGQAA